MLIIIFYSLLFYLSDQIAAITSSIYYGHKCKHDCKKCKMWSCTHETSYPAFDLPPYNDFSNVCGKRKFSLK